MSYATNAKAVLLVKTFRDGLARGDKFYSVYGEPLLTLEAILKELMANRTIQIESKSKVEEV